MMPTVQAARMTLAADPDRCTGVAAGILGCRAGPGTAEPCGRLLLAPKGGCGRRGRRARRFRETLAGHSRMGAGLRGSATRSTAFDPRAERILGSGRRTRRQPASMSPLALEVVAVASQVWGKPLVMNVSMPIAAVLLDLGFRRP